MAQTHADSGWIYHCGDIVVEPRAHRLERAGVALSVEPKAYAVLVVLLQQAGEVVAKDELLDAAWGHRHVTPGVLTRAISQLRHSLGDCAGDPRYIATVHSLGYRFIGEVRRIPAASMPEVAANDPAQPHPEIKPTAGTRRREHAPPLQWLAAAITLVVLVAVLAVVSLWHPPRGSLSSPRLSPRPALVLMPFAHSMDQRSLQPRHWPHHHRVATGYPDDPDAQPPELRATGYLSLRPEQAPAARG
ncbi:transcriptional regulator [Dyella sp. C9]|uniref:winged helix-turn-helix domain-containing protein n=1 Tax=Dyella sp. C9 TaxID=2202154 RepID=UPI00130090D6|nr:transcriptional regulator [Dyella sp. C9]